jgi:hypothetical protein
MPSLVNRLEFVPGKAAVRILVDSANHLTSRRFILHAGTFSKFLNGHGLVFFIVQSLEDEVRR